MLDLASKTQRKDALVSDKREWETRTSNQESTVEEIQRVRLLYGFKAGRSLWGKYYE